MRTAVPVVLSIGSVFDAATGPEANAIAQVQAQVRRRLLRVFLRRGLLPGDDAQAMAIWQHGSGFSISSFRHAISGG